MQDCTYGAIFPAKLYSAGRKLPDNRKFGQIFNFEREKVYFEGFGTHPICPLGPNMARESESAV